MSLWFTLWVFNGFHNNSRTSSSGFRFSIFPWCDLGTWQLAFHHQQRNQRKPSHGGHAPVKCDDFELWKLRELQSFLQVTTLRILITGINILGVRPIYWYYYVLVTIVFFASLFFCLSFHGFRRSDASGDIDFLVPPANPTWHKRLPTPNDYSVESPAHNPCGSLPMHGTYHK